MSLMSRDGRVIGTFGTTPEVSAEVATRDALAQQSLHDPLTG